MVVLPFKYGCQTVLNCIKVFISSELFRNVAKRLVNCCLRYLSTGMQNRSGVNLWVKRSLFCQLWEDVSNLYTPAADTHLLHSLPAGAVYFGLFYRYISLFHHR